MIKRPLISKEEIIADVVYVLVGMIVSALALLIFDMHWNFYGDLNFPFEKRVFTSMTPYYIGVPLGGIVGFFILKLLFFAFMEEEIAHKKEKKSKRL